MFSRSFNNFRISMNSFPLVINLLNFKETLCLCAMFRSVILNFQTFSNCGNESCSVDHCFPNFVVMEPHLTA